jgi:acyl-CoA dehydrogenase
MSDLESFRQQARAWLADNCPASMRTPYQSEADICWGGRHWTFASDDQRLWLERAAGRGLTAPGWPREYGGAGLSPEQARVFQEEMAAIGARPPLDNIFGLSMIGPALLQFGSEAQKREHLPRIVRGEVRWCQGYSEPGAGSDLASLATRAEDRGDHFLVNGAKVWTSYADKADWIFCLVRTDADRPKHGGISFLLFDMASEGVTTRPIRLISGKSQFCETRFDNVRVPKSGLMGPLNGGWTIAKYLLTHERASLSDFLSSSGQTPVHAIAAERLGTRNGRLEHDLLRARIAEFELDGAAFELTVQRAQEEAESGQGPGALSSFLKYYGTELNKRRYELLMDVEGQAGLAWEGASGDLSRRWLRSKANSIEGGTSEIQLNIIAKRVLDLPG